MKLKQAKEYLENFISEKPNIAIILGSGLGKFIHKINNKIELDFSEIPGYISPSIKGHEGKLIIGKYNDKSIICSQGRFHLYEGLGLNTITFPIQLFHELKCKNLLITNSGGCLQKNWEIGGFMNISSLIDFTFINSEKAFKTVFTQLLNKEKFIKYAKSENINLYDGCYTWTQGPSYETPAEIKEIKSLGGNAVGMSTYPEILKAMELNMNVVGVTCLTNYAAGISKQILTHTDVVSRAKKSNSRFCKLIDYVIKNININE